MNASTIAPVRKTITVSRTIEDAFRIFTEELGAWWPLGSHALDTRRARSVRVTPAVGGTVAETYDDGTEAPWGLVRAWEPPRRFAMSWNVTDVETLVEVTFSPEGGSTRIELVHSGWEHFREAAEAKREAYDAGWPTVLARFAASI